MALRRQALESPIPQHPSERVSYSWSTTPWGGSPSSLACAAYDITNGANTLVTSTVFPTNNPSASGDDITLSLLRDMTVDHDYRIELSAMIGNNTLLFYFVVNCRYTT